MEFNEQQKEIIENVEGAFLLSAPVGTGKTTVLTERVIKALKTGIKPEEILCLTFTNRAAEEMAKRIRSRVSKKEIFDEITIKTFHGFCAYFIKSEAKEIGISPDFVIFEEEEHVEVMKEILERHPEVSIESERQKREILGLIDKIYSYRLDQFYQEIGIPMPNFEINEIYEKVGQDYCQLLDGQNALDFNELVILCLRALYGDEKIRNKWAKKYRFIQLDEFQDTHLSEYLVVKELAKVHQNVAFVGDLDQTIYSWRGSRPFFLYKLIKSHFPKVKELSLITNYRFNPAILAAIKSFLSSFLKPNTKELETLGEESGEKKCIDVFGAYNFSKEISWVIGKIKELKEKEKRAKMVVIARNNALIERTAEVFKDKGVSHITVDKYEFFRKQEIKDIYAYLKIIFNRFDLESAHRIIRRPSRNIGLGTINTIRASGNPIGLKVSDFLNFKNYKYPEPFFNLINKWQKDRLIVLDTETTGIDVLSDEVIQIFAIEIVNGQKGEEFHYYLKNTTPVGFSEAVHGLSDKYLKECGSDPKEALAKLKEFIGQDAVIGHNVNFDLSMLVENGKRHGIEFIFKDYYDTLDMAKRLVDAPNYRLSTLAKSLGLTIATHDARDDVMATADLLGILVEKFKNKSSERVRLWQTHSSRFLKLAGEIDSWQKIIEESRPAEALEKIWQKSGLAGYYQKDKEKDKRFHSIEELKKIFKERDDSKKRPRAALRELIHYASLVRNINFVGLEQGKVPIVTAHQVKGLEFDYVFIIGVNEFIFPVYKSDIEEEKRLFYVAMTRAKKKIFITYSQFKENDMPISKSPFIDYIDNKYIEFN